jgi:hypothetical protein
MIIKMVTYNILVYGYDKIFVNMAPYVIIG